MAANGGHRGRGIKEGGRGGERRSGEGRRGTAGRWAEEEDEEKQGKEARSEICGFKSVSVRSYSTHLGKEGEEKEGRTYT
jgi:hypothetical protein